MKHLFLSVFIYLTVGLNLHLGAQGHIFAKEGAQVSIQPLLSSPFPLFKSVHSEFGHLTTVKGLPIHFGIGLGVGGARGWGGSANLIVRPLSYEVDFQFLASPDPYIPDFSLIRQQYLQLEVQGYRRVFQKGDFEGGVILGLNLFILARHKDDTRFTNGENRSDQLGGDFRMAVGAYTGGLEISWSMTERLGLKGQPLLRYFPVSFSRLEYTEEVPLAFGGQLSLIVLLGGN